MCDNVSLIITTIITNNTANSETDARLFCSSEQNSDKYRVALKSVSNICFCYNTQTKVAMTII